MKTDKNISETQRVFSQRIKRLRQERNLYAEDQGGAYGYAEMTKRFGKTEAAIRSWESGRTMPSADILVEIAFEFECTVDYLLGKSNYRIDSRYYRAYETRLLETIERLSKNQPFLIMKLTNIFDTFLRFENEELATWFLALLRTIGDTIDTVNHIWEGPESWSFELIKAAIPKMENGYLYIYALGKISEYKKECEYFLTGYYLTLLRLIEEANTNNPYRNETSDELFQLAMLGKKEELFPDAFNLAKERAYSAYEQEIDEGDHSE